MTQAQIETLLNMPFSKLAELCRDPQILARVISISYNLGSQNRETQVHRWYKTRQNSWNEMFPRN